MSLIIIVALAAFICGLLVYRFFSRMLQRLIVQRRFRRGRKGEEDAEQFLRRHGFRIIEKQATRRMRMLVDGEPREFDIRADFIVKKGSRKCIVEVKSGEAATNPASIDTRRQLLEYTVSYNADKVYLFDADQSTMSEVLLPMVKTRTAGGIYVFAAGAVIGAIAMLLLLKGG